MNLDYRPPPVLAPGYRLDRYELLCPIAEGGMASVWVARMRGKHGFERFVAVKTILPRFASDPGFQKMFLDEARLASRIEHTNVAQILDLGEQHDVLFMVMEWVDGDALSKLLSVVSKKQKKMPNGIVLRVLADACSGLHAAHELHGADGASLNVVHRDVSPQNILVSTRGVAKVIDFGIAKARDRVGGETSSGVLKGKVKYMAPEQALGRAIDRRVDVWAVGAILYRVLAGRPAYAGANDLEMLHALTSGAPPAPLPESVPPPIAAIAMRALSHDIDRRYATCADMAAALERAMAEIGALTSTRDVQAFVGEHLRERTFARKETLDLALQAARERERMAQLLQPTDTDSASGIVDVGSRGGTIGMRRSTAPPPPPVANGAAAPAIPRPPLPPISAPRLPVAPSSAPRTPSAPVTPQPFAPNSSPHSPTASPLAPIALPAPASDDADVAITLSRSSRRRRLTLAVGFGVAALAIATTIAIVFTQGGGQPRTTARRSLASWAKLEPPPAPASTFAPSMPIASVSSPLALPQAPPPGADAPRAQTQPRPPSAPVATAPVVTAPAATTPPPATAAPTRKPRVDDGF